MHRLVNLEPDRIRILFNRQRAGAGIINLLSISKTIIHFYHSSLLCLQIQFDFVLVKVRWGYLIGFPVTSGETRLHVPISWQIWWKLILYEEKVQCTKNDIKGKTMRLKEVKRWDFSHYVWHIQLRFRWSWPVSIHLLLIQLKQMDSHLNGFI